MKQVDGTLQPITDDALRDDGDYVRVIDHILGHVRRRHIPGQGMPVVQRARSCHVLRRIGYRWFSAVLLVNISTSFCCNASHDLTRLLNFFD